LDGESGHNPGRSDDVLVIEIPQAFENPWSPPGGAADTPIRPLDSSPTFLHDDGLRIR
jgi:hypothetical protein